MTILQFRRSDRPRTTRTSRKLQPAVEGCESRQLLSGATVAGASVSPLIKHGNGAIVVVADAVLRKHVPDCKMAPSVPDCKMAPDGADAVLRKHVPDCKM